MEGERIDRERRVAYLESSNAAATGGRPVPFPLAPTSPRKPGKASDRESALAHYHRERGPRTARITRLSRWWGRSGLWTAAPLAWLRDQAYRSTPASWFERGMRDQYGYDPGALERGSIT